MSYVRVGLGKYHQIYCNCLLADFAQLLLHIYSIKYVKLSQNIKCGVVVVTKELIVYRRKSHKNQLVLCTTATIPNFSHTIRGCGMTNNVIENFCMPCECYGIVKA